MNPVSTDNDRQRRPRGETISLRLSPRLIEALDRFALDRNGLTRQEALVLALRHWATEKGYLAPRETPTVPLDRLNARNDG